MREMMYDGEGMIILSLFCGTAGGVMLSDYGGGLCC